MMAAAAASYLKCCGKFSSVAGLWCARVGAAAGLATTRRSSASAAAVNKAPQLSLLMHMDKVGALSGEEIARVWADFHAQKNIPCGVITAHEYNTLQSKAKQCPNFVIPTVTANSANPAAGFQAFFVQWQMPYYAIFTGADEYRILGAASKPLYKVTHYTELLATKGIVLARGEAAAPIDNRPVETSAGVTPEQGRQLFDRLHAFYGTSGGERRWSIVQRFNSGAPDFSFEQLLEECRAM